MFYLKPDHNPSKSPCFDIDLLLAYGAAYRKVARHEYVFQEDQRPMFYYAIESGRIKMFNHTDDGKEFIQGIFTEGDSFGEPALLLGSPYPASAIATEDTLLIRMGRDRYLQLLHENPEVHFQFTCMLAKRLISKTASMRDLSCHGPEHRIQNLLKTYKESCGAATLQPFKVELTRQEIADMTGLRVETVIRTVKAMAEKGILTIDNRRVYF